MSVLKPKKKQKVVTFDRDSLAFHNHQAMLSGICLVADQLSAKIKGGNKLSILVLGTGVGIFTTFLRNHFAANLLKLVTVEPNELMLKLAQDHFGFTTEDDAVLDLVSADTYDFVMQHPPNQFDLIFMDVLGEEAGLRPSAKFHESEFLNKLNDLAVEEGGLTIMNTKIHDSQIKKKCFT